VIAELRTLLAVARHGTFAAAGARIGLTQAAVSGQIKRLEAQLGLRLFDRTGRSATLNADGLRTLARAQELVARFDALADPATPDTAQARLRIGAIASVQTDLLPGALARWRQAHPRRPLQVVPGISLHLMDQLDAGELELAVMIRPPFGTPAGLAWTPLRREPYMLLVPATLRARAWRSVLEAHPFIRYERSSFGGRQVDRFLRTQRLQPRESIEVDDLPAMTALVAAGLGVALVPCADDGTALPPTVRAMRLGEAAFHREIGLLRPGQGMDDPALEELVASLRAEAATPASRRSR